MNLTDKEVDKICDRLRLLVAEFGSSNVIVAVPTRWRSFSEETKLGGVDLVFSTEKHVLIRAGACGGAIEYQYAVT